MTIDIRQRWEKGAQGLFAEYVACCDSAYNYRKLAILHATVHTCSIHQKLLGLVHI